MNVREIEVAAPDGAMKTLLIVRLNADKVYRPAPATFWLVGKYGPFQAATAPAP